MIASLAQLPDSDAVLTVAGLTTYLKSLLEDDPQLHQLWITGEVSSANQYRSGLFFTLQDPDAKAAINCLAWKNQLHKLVTLPHPGEQVMVLGKIHLHAQRGNYQLIAWQVLPAGEGLRALRYRQLRNRLQAEGLFDASQKRSLPPYPQTVAVVTSPQAAAWGDIQRTLRRRYPGLRVLFSPALVQGSQAPDSIVRAIRRVAEDGRAEVLILSRGGGAVEDMACFNDERVVRAISDCPVPIVAGIGHQRDESLADLAADVCAHTPTAAAEQAVPRLLDLQHGHQHRSVTLHNAIAGQVQGARAQLYQLQERLRRLHLDRQIRQDIQQIADLKQRLSYGTSQQLQQSIQYCRLLRQTLYTLDPHSVLQRGYALVRQENRQIARSVSELQVGQTVQIHLGQGQVRAQVIDIVSEEASDLS